MSFGRELLEYAGPGEIVPVNSNWPVNGTLIRRHDDGSVTVRVDRHFIRARWDEGWEGFENDDTHRDHRDEELNRLLMEPVVMPQFLHA